jgi:phospholipid/cholesterol/gamma-HCH transport system substrate-binding protein
MKKYSHETVVGVFVIIGLLCVGYLTLKLGKLSPFGGDYYALYAKFTSVSGLATGNPVDMFGLQVGQVADFKMDQEDQLVVVKMNVKKGTKIYSDAVASIKTSGLIGAKYVSIDPGGSGQLLKAGGVIVDTEPSTNIGDLISRYVFGTVKKK